MGAKSASVRFWNPKRAAAHRIAEDALEFYTVDAIRRVVDRLPAAVPPETGFAAEGFREGLLKEGADVRLVEKLSRLGGVDPSMFRMVLTELSKYRTARGKGPGSP